MSNNKELSLSERELLENEVKKLGDEIRLLKAEKADPNIVKERIARMLEKKALLGDTGKTKFTLKTPKGTRDFNPQAMVIREKVLNLVTNVFKVHGGEAIDTPVFELKEILMGKYGDEGGKLVFDLADQGGELCSLRYDLTVPFARYLAQNKITNIKKYQIAKVYRRDQPYMTRGRYREFYQCDFDIAGQYDSMIPESECIKIMDDVLGKLDIGTYEIRINHRLFLEGIFEICGAPSSEFKNVCSSIDKLDKQPWEEVKEELVKVKFIKEDVVDKLEKYVRLREQNPSLSRSDLLEWFEKDEVASKNVKIKTAIDEMKLMFEYCECFGAGSCAAFEPSLARGLDYYTGVIYEAIILETPFSIKSEDCDEEEKNARIGSVAAGGRYDTLVGMFLQLGSNDKKNKTNVPCVGVSFGIERLFTLMEMKHKSLGTPMRTNEIEVFVATAQKGLLKERMNICKELWGSDIKAEMVYKKNPKLLTQLQYCEEKAIPYAIIIGQREIEEGVVKVRNVVNREENDVKLNDLSSKLKELLKC
ncbi:Histidine--tRNA ligase, cytoplasmic [Strongyloides ratti]|uniref:histidine--tRNA ligase n=1 Tax=Strongyloides ratti TaxID=34506 RepID=A0A090L282_STRRB|nr:Histidine--tRNA ligase, cytoplasmic [Strongyloides ratti]CEF63792.1 Histidine--tRNA ligase, cytoplasmic [Strongyloides ratti]